MSLIEFIDMSSGRTITGGVTPVAPTAAATATAGCDGLDLNSREVAAVARGMVAIIGVADVMEDRFGRDDALTHLMRAAAETCRDMLRDNTTPEQVALLETVLGKRIEL
jgi:hypothetical protein